MYHQCPIDHIALFKEKLKTKKPKSREKKNNVFSLLLIHMRESTDVHHNHHCSSLGTPPTNDCPVHLDKFGKKYLTEKSAVLPTPETVDPLFRNSVFPPLCPILTWVQ
jgi:hypothetical protein